MNCYKQIISGALQLACQAQNMHNIQTGTKIIEILNNHFHQKIIINNLLPLAKETLDLTDDWDYRRLMELLEKLNLQNQLTEMIEFGLSSTNNEIIEAAKEWKNR